MEITDMDKENQNKNMLSKQQKEKIESLENQKINLKKKTDKIIYGIGVQIVVTAESDRNIWREDEEGVKIAFSKLRAVAIQENLSCISKIQKEIAELDKEIEYVKNTFLCTKCWKPIDKEAVFCKFCGHYLKTEKIEGDKAGANCCSFCGFTLTEDAIHCPNCGEKVKQDVPYEIGKMDMKKEAGGKRCKACGNILSYDAIFCNECGTQY